MTDRQPTRDDLETTQWVLGKLLISNTKRQEQRWKVWGDRRESVEEDVRESEMSKEHKNEVLAALYDQYADRVKFSGRAEAEHYEIEVAGTFYGSHVALKGALEVVQQHLDKWKDENEES